MAIFFTILFGIGFIVTFILSIKFKRQSESARDAYDIGYNKKLSKKTRIVSFALIAVLIISLLLSGIRIIDSTTIGVIRKFGVIESTTHEGINLINPYCETVEKYDLKVRVGHGDFSSYTKDAQPVDVSIEFQFAMDPTYAKEIAKVYGTQEMHEAKIVNLVEEKVKSVFSKYGAMTLLENRSKLSSVIDEALVPLEEMFHITIKSVIVKDIDFSEAFEKSVEAKMEAEQDALKAEQEKKKAIIEAEQKKEVAQIEAEAAIAAAQGKAEAMRITKDALANMPSSYIKQLYLEKWNGVLPTIVTEGSNLMITPSFGE